MQCIPKNNEQIAAQILLFNIHGRSHLDRIIYGKRQAPLARTTSTYNAMLPYTNLTGQVSVFFFFASMEL